MFSFFEKLIDPFPAGPQTRPPDRLIAFCWHYTKGIWPYLLLASVLVAVVSLLEVTLLGFLGNIVNWLSSADRQSFLGDEAGRLIVMGLIVLVLMPLFSLAHSLVLHQTILGNFPMIVRWLGHNYLLGQSYGFYQDEFAGRIATKLMQTSLSVREAVTKLLDVLVYVGVYFFGALGLMFTIDPLLIVPFVVWILAYILLLSRLLPKLAEAARRLADARSEMTGRVVDSYTNIMTVKLFAHAGGEEQYARSAMSAMLERIHPLMRNITLLNWGIDILNALLLFSSAALAIWLWLDGAGSPGAVAVSVGLILRLSGMSHWIMWEMSNLFENIGTVRDGMATLSRPREVLDAPGARQLQVGRGLISFEHIRFHYGRQSGVIENLSLEIRPGEKVGIVGRSGSGKTTLTNLLLRLYDLEGGRIRIDDQDIAHVTQQSLRAAIGVVTQDTSLLHRSLAENIAYGRPGAARDEIIAAAKRANAHEFILTLEDRTGNTGYDAQVGERGIKLSGGQRQRIAIARMFLKNAPILLLDEATSALDSEVESAIHENLYALMEGKTVIAIAHRLSTISALDRLVVMDRGHIAEQGSHEELIAAGGIYAGLWQRQSGGFIGDELK